MKKNQNDKIKSEIAYLDTKIADLERKRDRYEVDEIDALEDLSNWNGWRDALKWVDGGCEGNPHEGDE